MSDMTNAEATVAGLYSGSSSDLVHGWWAKFSSGAATSYIERGKLMSASSREFSLRSNPHRRVSKAAGRGVLRQSHTSLSFSNFLFLLVKQEFEPLSKNDFYAGSQHRHQIRSHYEKSRFNPRHQGQKS